MRVSGLLFSCVLFASTAKPHANNPYSIKAHYTSLDRKLYASQIMKSAILFKKQNHIGLGDTRVEAVGKDCTILFIEDHKIPKYNWPILTYKNDAIKQTLIDRGFKEIIFDFSEDEICIYDLENNTLHFENLVDVNYKYGSTNVKRYI